MDFQIFFFADDEYSILPYHFDIGVGKIEPLFDYFFEVLQKAFFSKKLIQIVS